jgi:hypothetical protein
MATCVLAIANPQITFAFECSKPDDIHSFAESLDPSAVPAPPTKSCPLYNLELYRSNLEIYRENTIEGYGEKLDRFVKKLVQLDEDYRITTKSKACTNEQYEATKPRIASELEKARSEYRDPYKKSMFAYYRFFELYKRTYERQRLSGPC